MDLNVLFSNLVGLFLLIGVGFFAVRLGILPAEASGPLTTLLMKITLPATIITSMLRPYDPEFLRLGLSIMILVTAALLLFWGLSVPLSRVLRVPEGRRGMWCCCTTFWNNGFMGFPVALALFGEEGLALTVILGVPFTLFLFNLGAGLVCMDCPEDGAARSRSWRKAVFSVSNVSVAISLVLYFTQLPLPQAVLAPLNYLSSATTPLSMIIIGISLSQGKLSDVLRDRDVFTASAVRLLLFPLIAWAGMRLVPGLNSLVMRAAFINITMPAPAIATLMGEEYGGCVQLGARTVFLSSLLCIVTIPLMSLLL